jgi:membrane-associated phospholipid phosphatase
MSALTGHLGESITHRDATPATVGMHQADRWRAVRWALVIGYVAAWLWWVRVHGLIYDRITITIALVVLLVLGHVGRPLYRWRLLAIDVIVYAALWYAYERTRGAADQLGMPVQVESVRNLDRVLFFGADPTVWLQRRFYEPSHVRWYDVAGSIVYHTHFVVPVAVIAALWLTNRGEWVRFIRRFATVLLGGCIMFVLLPTAPPWMAAANLDALPPVARPTGRGWVHIGLSSFTHAWDVARDWANPIAAMPSLHAAFALLVVVFFFPRIPQWWARGLLLLYPAAMALTLVYFAEHYLVDALAGWALVGVSFLAWHRIEQRSQQRRAPVGSTL